MFIASKDLIQYLLMSDVYKAYVQWFLFLNKKIKMVKRSSESASSNVLFNIGNLKQEIDEKNDK